MRKNNPQISFKLSKYVKVFNFKDTYCFLNCLSLNKVYVLKDSNLNNYHVFRLFKKNNLLKNFDIKAKRFINNYHKGFSPNFKQLYLILSETCNFSCKYCRQMTHGLRRKSVMSSREVKNNINLFFQLTHNKPSGIVFYGGEPLLNKKILLEAIAYIRERESNLKIEKPLDLTIITNGTNIDKLSARLLKKYNVYTIVSIDGNKSEHNKFRVYKNNQGTFDDVIRGYKIYKSAGCKVGISCTIGSHNYNKLTALFDYFAKKLKPVNVGINLPHDDYKNPLNFGMDFRKFCDYFFKVFEKSTKNNLYIEHIMRKLILLFHEEIKINDCPACGGRLVILPGGKMGICEGAIGMENFFFKNVDKAKKMSLNWYKTSPLFHKKCQNCLALGLCGGGCPFDGYLQAKKVGHRDERRCYFIKMIVEWGLYNFYINNKEKIKKVKIFAPSAKEQNNFLRKIKATKTRLPLRSSAQYGNIMNQF